MSWDSAPPSAKEMSAWMDAPPSAEELQALEPAQEVDTGEFEAFGRGAVQDLTLGFADEIAGGAEALWDVATTDSTLDDFRKLYDQHLSESRAEFKANEEAHPWATTAGNIAGGVAGALAMPAGAAAKLGGAGIKGAMKMGAGMGAAYGLGNSEASLLDGEFGEAAKDVAVGSVAGTVGGAAGQIVADTVGPGAKALAKRVGELGSKAKSAVSQIEMIEDVGKSLKLGWEKQTLVGNKANQRLNKLARGLVKGPEGYKSKVSEMVEILKGLQGKAHKDADPVALADFYEKSKPILAQLEDYARNDEDSLKIITRMRKDIDDYINGVAKKFTLKGTVPVEKPNPAGKELEKFLNTADTKNAMFELQQQQAAEDLASGKRTFEGFGDLQDDVVMNEFPNFDGELAPLSYMTKNGDELVTATPIEPIWSKGNKKTGEAPKVIGYKGIQKGQADVLETATRRIKEKIVEADLPYDVMTRETKSLGRVAAIVDKRSGKILKVVKESDLLAKPEIIDEAVEIPLEIRIPDAKGPNMEMGLDKVKEMQDKLGVFAKFGEKSKSTPKAVKKVASGFTSELKTIMEKDNPDLAEINSVLHQLFAVQKSIPSLAEAVASEKGGVAGLTAYDKLETLREALPDINKVKNPQIKEALQKIQDLMVRTSDVSDQFRLRNKISSMGLGNNPIVEAVSGTVRGLYYAAPNIAGMTGRALYDASPQALQSVAKAIATTPGKSYQAVANVLNQAAAKDNIGRNALIFTLQQNPEYRKILEEYSTQEKEKKE